MANFDLLFNDYKKTIDSFINQYEQLPENPTLKQYLDLRNVYYASKQIKREIKKAMMEDSSLKIHLKDVIEYNFYKIPEFEPIKKFEQVIKLRERRDLAKEVVNNSSKKSAKNAQYITALNAYCEQLGEQELNTKLSEKFPKATARQLPSQEDLSKLVSKVSAEEVNVA